MHSKQWNEQFYSRLTTFVLDRVRCLSLCVLGFESVLARNANTRIFAAFLFCITVIVEYFKVVNVEPRPGGVVDSPDAGTCMWIATNQKSINGSCPVQNVTVFHNAPENANPP